MSPRLSKVGLRVSGGARDDLHRRPSTEAIACLDEPLQIIACAGSGKTQVISQRIAAILAQPGVEPRNVIAFTFTEKAAAELKERIHRDRRAGAGVSTRARRDVHRHDARLLPRPAAAARAGDVQVLRADRHHDAAARRPQQPEVRADDVPDALAGDAARCGASSTRSSTCRRRACSARTRSTEDLVPAGVLESFTELHEAALRQRVLRLHRDDQPRGPVPRRRPGRGRGRRQSSSSTSATTSATSSSTSTRTSTRCRSGSSRG